MFTTDPWNFVRKNCNLQAVQKKQNSGSTTKKSAHLKIHICLFLTPHVKVKCQESLHIRSIHVYVCLQKKINFFWVVENGVLKTSSKELGHHWYFLMFLGPSFSRWAVHWQATAAIARVAGEGGDGVDVWNPMVLLRKKKETSCSDARFLRLPFVPSGLKRKFSVWIVFLHYCCYFPLKPNRDFSFLVKY